MHMNMDPRKTLSFYTPHTTAKERTQVEKLLHSILSQHNVFIKEQNKKIRINLRHRTALRMR